MVLGNTLDILLKVNVDIKELAALRVAQRRISKFSTRAQGKIGGLTARMGLLQRRFAQSEVSARSLSQSMQALNMRMLGLMFTGLNLAFMFGMILSLTPGLGGALRGLAAGISTALLPATRMLMPHIMNLTKSFLNMDKSTRKLFSKIVILGTILGVVLGLFGLLAMAILNIGSLILSAVAAINTFVAALTVLPVLLNAGVLSIKALAIAVTGLAALFLGAFAAVSAAFAFLGKKMGLIITGIIVAIGALVAAFVAVPAGIAIAAGAIIAAVWAMRKDIINALQGVIDFLAGVFMRTVRKRIRAFKNIFKGLKTFFSGIGQILGGNFVDGLEKAIRGAAGVIRSAINAILPLGLTISKLASAAGSVTDAAANIISANDFVVTSDGKIIQPSAQDTIIGTENPQALGGGGGGQVNITIENPELNNDVDVESLIDEIERRLEQDQRSRSLI